MSLHILRHALLLLAFVCQLCAFARVDIHAEVGVLTEAPALPVLAADNAANHLLQPAEHHTGQTTAMGNDSVDAHPAHIAADSLSKPVDTLALGMVTDSVAAKAGRVKLPKPQFRPNPQRALWLSLVFPGAGQIYNRKYWKLPFIYGGFLGCAYALMWNQQMYRDYLQAYLDIMDDNPNTNSYLEMLPPRYDIAGREEQFKKLFKRKKDFYRRYRDLSAFCFVGVYLLSVVDAYVDAQLSDFDISPDLTLSVEPAVIGAPASPGSRGNTAYGVGCSFRF